MDNLLSDYYTKQDTDSLVAGVYAIASRAALTVAHDTWTDLTLDFEHDDSIGIFAAPDDEVYCTSAGVYLITGQVQFPSNTAGIRGVQIYESNIYGIGNETVYANPVVDGGETTITVTMVLPMDEGDYVRLLAYQSSGGSMNSNVYCRLSVVKLGG